MSMLGPILAQILVGCIDDPRCRRSPKARRPPTAWRRRGSCVTPSGATKVRALGRLVGLRRTEQSLDLVARGTALAPEVLQALRALPPDAQNGRRLTLISDMLDAYHSIDARTLVALLELRRSLGPLPLLTAAERRRKQPGR